MRERVQDALEAGPALTAARHRLVRTLAAAQDQPRRALASAFCQVAEKCWTIAKNR